MNVSFVPELWQAEIKQVQHYPSTGCSEKNCTCWISTCWQLLKVCTKKKYGS